MVQGGSISDLSVLPKYLRCMTINLIRTRSLLGFLVLWNVNRKQLQQFIAFWTELPKKLRANQYVVFSVASSQKGLTFCKKIK